MDRNTLKQMLDEQRQRRQAGRTPAPSAGRTSQVRSSSRAFHYSRNRNEYQWRNFLAILGIVLASVAILTGMMFLSSGQKGEASVAAAIPSPSPAPALTETASSIPPAGSFTAHVCTNVPNGFLSIRAQPGEGTAVNAWLAEGQQAQLAVKNGVILAITLGDGSVWNQLEKPDGWANARYLCGVEEK